MLPQNPPSPENRSREEGNVDLLTSKRKILEYLT